MRLHHVTGAASLASVLERGLDPARSREPSFRARQVYLASDAPHAVGYAEGPFVRFEVDVDSLDQALLGPDDVDLPDLIGDAWADAGWQESLAESGQCAYAGVIPPRNLVLREAFVPAGGGLRERLLSRGGEAFARALAQHAGMEVAAMSGPEGTRFFAAANGLAWDAEGFRPEEGLAGWCLSRFGLQAVRAEPGPGQQADPEAGRRAVGGFLAEMAEATGVPDLLAAACPQDGPSPLPR